MSSRPENAAAAVAFSLVLSKAWMQYEWCWAVIYAILARVWEPRFAMGRFFKQNIVLVVGIALPLLLMAFFYFAGRASVAGIDPPQYDAVFVVDYNEHWTDYPYRIGVDDGKLFIRVQPPDDAESAGRNPPKVYVFQHKTLDTRRLNIDFKTVQDGRVDDPEIDALNERQLITDPTSPDGFRFEPPRHSSGLGVVGSLFGFDRNRNDYVLKKGARVIALETPDRHRPAQFIAWVGK